MPSDSPYREATSYHPHYGTMPVVNGPDGFQSFQTPGLVARLNEQHAEIERLREIVDKLPKTADGVPVVPGMVYWFEYTNAPGEFSNDFASDIYNAAGETEFDKDCYSTREAAEAARKAAG